MKYISINGKITTIVELLGSVNANGVAEKVMVIEAGYLMSKKYDVINDFQLHHGILKFIPLEEMIIL